MAKMNITTAREVAKKSVRPYILSELKPETPIGTVLSGLSTDEIFDIKLSVHRYSDLAGYTAAVSSAFLRKASNTLQDLAVEIRENSWEE